MLRSAMTYAQPDYLASPEERYVTLPRKTIRRHVSKINFESLNARNRSCTDKKLVPAAQKFLRAEHGLI